MMMRRCSWLAALGRRNPERFPTIEEFVEMNRRYPEPMFPSEEEAERLENERTYEARFVWRAAL